MIEYFCIFKYDWIKTYSFYFLNRRYLQFIPINWTKNRSPLLSMFVSTIKILSKEIYEDMEYKEMKYIRRDVSIYTDTND